MCENAPNRISIDRKIELGFTFGLLVASIIYAVLAYCGLQKTTWTVEQTTRPWVVVSGVGPPPEFTPGVPSQVELDIRNSGGGVALNLTQNLAPLLTKEPLTSPCPTPPIDLSTHPSGITLGAGYPIKAPVGIRGLDAAEIDHARTKGYYLVGLLEYVDQFQKPHQTEFCVEYTPRTKGFVACSICGKAN